VAHDEGRVAFVAVFRGNQAGIRVVGTQAVHEGRCRRPVLEIDVEVDVVLRTEVEPAFQQPAHDIAVGVGVVGPV